MQRMTPELLAMADELDSLGGGDARVVEAQAFCHIAPPIGRAPAIIQIEPEADTLHVFDPHCPDGAPEAQAVRRFRLSPGGVPDPHVPPLESLFGGCGASALDSVLSGFNAAVVVVGESGVGKTRALFGDTQESAAPGGLCAQLLDVLYEAVERSALDAGDGAPLLTLSVTVSCETFQKLLRKP